MHYEGKDYPFTVEQYNSLVPDSPAKYREAKESGLNEMRIASGLQPKKIYKTDKTLRSLQNAAGVI
jgi:hypothetical protein